MSNEYQDYLNDKAMDDAGPIAESLTRLHAIQAQWKTQNIEKHRELLNRFRAENDEIVRCDEDDRLIRTLVSMHAHVLDEVDKVLGELHRAELFEQEFRQRSAFKRLEKLYDDLCKIDI